jgi:sugar lactone lactonase YvrE
MNRKLLFCIVLLCIGLFEAIPVLAGSVFVSELASGSVVEVDEFGAQTIFASGLGRPSTLKFDKKGNLFVLDHGEQNSSPRILKVATTGETTTFTASLPPISDGNVTRSFNDLAISNAGKVFLLAFAFPSNSGTLPFTEVWELDKGKEPVLFVAIKDEVQPRQLASDFTFGPGGDLYLSLTGGVTGVDEVGGRIIRVTRTGKISVFFDPEFPPLNCALGGLGVDFDAIAFNAQGALFILGREGTEGPPVCSQTRIIWELQGGILSTFVDSGVIGNGALSLAIDANDNLFVSGGGFGGGQPDGFVQRVDLSSGTITTLTTFPGSGPIFDIDDDNFDSFHGKAGRHRD